MWRILSWPHGLLEIIARRVYQKGACQLGAECAKWKGIRITARSTVLPKIISALESLELTAGPFHRVVQTNLTSITCAEGIETRTLPVTRTFLIDPGLVEKVDREGLAYMLVQSAAYSDFYAKRFIFLPSIFFKGRNRKARADAKKLAENYRSAVTQSDTRN